MKTRYLLSAAIIGSLFVSLSYGVPWSTFRGNAQRTGFYPNKVGVPPVSGDRLWHIQLPGPIVSSPAIVGGVLYVGCRDSSLYAIDASTGEVIWSIKTGGWVDSSPLVFGNRVFVGSRDGYIYAVDINLGEVLARFPAGVQLSSPIVYNSQLLLTGLGPPVNSFTAYNLASSSWKMVDTAWSASLPQMSYSSPAIFKDITVFGAMDGRFYAKGALDGSNVWDFGTGGGIYMSSPAIDDSIVYMAPGNYDDAIYAQYLQSGAQKWKRSPTESYLPKKSAGQSFLPSHQFRMLLKHSPAYRLQALDAFAKRGMVLPKVAVTSSRFKSQGASWVDEGGMKTSSVAVGPNNVYVIQKELGRLFNDDGSTQYMPRFTLTGFDKNTGTPTMLYRDERVSERLGYTSSPVVANLIEGGQVVYFGWGEGRVYALKPAAGQEPTRVIWQDSLQGHVISSPAISDGKLVFATMQGHMYAYELKEQADAKIFRDSVFAWPNPVRDNATQANIHVYLSLAGEVTVTIYNTAERPVTVLREQVNSGDSDIIWQLNDIANGIYFGKVEVKYTGSGDKDSKWIKIAIIRK